MFNVITKDERLSKTKTLQRHHGVASNNYNLNNHQSMYLKIYLNVIVSYVINKYYFLNS